MKVTPVIISIFLTVSAISGCASQSFTEFYADTKKTLTLQDSENINQISQLLISGNKIYLVDRVASEIRVYTQNGEFMTILGGKGKGPGEFMSIQCWGSFDGGTIYYDSLLARLTIFDDLPQLKKTINLDFGTAPIGFNIIDLKDGNIVLPFYSKERDDANMIIYNITQEKLIATFLSSVLKKPSDILKMFYTMHLIDEHRILMAYGTKNLIRVFNIATGKTENEFSLSQAGKDQNNPEENFKFSHITQNNQYYLIRSIIPDKKGCFVIDKTSFREIGFLEDVQPSCNYNMLPMYKDSSSLFTISNLRAKTGKTEQNAKGPDSSQNTVITDLPLHLIESSNVNIGDDMYYKNFLLQRHNGCLLIIPNYSEKLFFYNVQGNTSALINLKFAKMRNLATDIDSGDNLYLTVIGIGRYSGTYSIDTESGNIKEKMNKNILEFTVLNNTIYSYDKDTATLNKWIDDRIIQSRKVQTDDYYSDYSDEELGPVQEAKLISAGNSLILAYRNWNKIKFFDSDLNTTASANIPGGGTTFLKREDMEKKRWGYLVKNFIVDIKAQGDYFFLATEGENGLFHVFKTDANYLGKIDAEDCQIGSFEILDSDIYYVGRHNSHVNLYKLENWASGL